MLRLAMLVACAGGTASAPERKETGTGVADSGTSDTGPCTEQIWYHDGDGDGYGDSAGIARACDPPPGYVAEAGDCDDTHPTASVGSTDVATDGADTDCDGAGVIAAVRDLPRWSLAGEARDHDLGYTIAPPADLDGDGWPDLLVSHATNANESIPDGGAYMLPGPLAVTPGPKSASAAGAKLWGAEGDNLAHACVPGDVDGDGFNDVLLGFPYGPWETGYQGVAYLLHGPIAGETSLPASATTFLGTGWGSYLGRCAGPGDLDGDGLADVVLSASESGAEEPAFGFVYVIRGPADHGDIGQAEMTLRGQAPRDDLWIELAELGDVDGDGLGDFAASNRANAGAGDAAFVVTEFVPGRPALGDVSEHLDYTSGDAASGSDGQMDYLVPAGLGDIDGDGYAEIGLGEAGYGWVYWVMDGPFQPGATRVVTEEYRTVLLSNNRGFYSDLSVAVGLGDFNDDGVEANDVAVGNRKFVASTIPDGDSVCFAWEEQCDTGAVFLLAAPIAAGVIDLEISADRLEGTFRHQQLGAALGAGDLDGDRVPDLVIGSPCSDWETESTVGVVDVLFGGARGF